MRYLFFDTETTGLARFHVPPDDPSQPRLVQLAAMLTEDDGRVINQFSLIIRPEGFAIPEQAAAVHGITTEYARRMGVMVRPALSLFRRLANQCDAVVAHNIAFDRIVMAGEFARDYAGDWIHEAAAQMCTLQMSSRHTVPGQKSRKLGDIYEAFFGSPLQGAHDAMVDALACSRIFWRMLELEKQPSMLFTESQLPERENPIPSKSITE